MAQLRAKQIKLVAQDDLLIGGANGNGAVLSKGTAGQVLKVLVGGALGYEKAAAADTTIAAITGIVATDVQGALAEIHGNVEALSEDLNEASEATDLAINTVRTGAGLGSDGTYVKDADATYIADATSLANADSLLDAKLAELADDLAALGTGSITDLQTEVDAIETAVGLTSDGLFDNTGYAASLHTGVADVAANTVKAKILAVDAALTAAESTLAAADTALDGRLDTLETDFATAQGDITALETALENEVTARAAGDTALQTELDALEVTVGAKGDGTPNLYANGNYIIAGSAGTPEVPTQGVEGEDGYVAGQPAVPGISPDNHTVAIGKLDAALKAEETARGAADVFIQAELDATQAGAGLATTGAYEAFTDSNYINSATTLKDADKLLDTKLKTVSDKLDALGSGSITTLQAEVDATQAALGFNEDGTKATWTSENYIPANATVKAAVEALDVRAKANYDAIVGTNSRIDALGNAFNYVGVLGTGSFESFAGSVDAENATDLADLPSSGKDAGDYYKVAADGYFKVGTGTAFFVKANDGLVWNTGGGVDKIDNTNSNVMAGKNISVTGSTDAGFTVSLNGIIPVENGGTGVAELADITSDSEAIVLTGGTASVVTGLSIDFDPSKVNFSELAQAGAPAANADGKYLRWNNTTQAIEYVSAAEVGSTVRAEEDFAPAAAANLAVTLAHAPLGDVAVFMNGVKLKKAGFLVSGSTVTLVDAANGYPYEDGDTLSVSYSYAG